MSGNHGYTTGNESSANRRSILRKMAAGTAGLVGIATGTGSVSAHQDCESELYCSRGRQFVRVCCEDGHCPVDTQVGYC